MPETNRYPLLAKPQVIELARKIKAGQKAQEQLDQAAGKKRRDLQSVIRQGRQAHDELVLRNQGLVISIAEKRVKPLRRLTLTDLIQFGNEGLIEAAGSFDPTLGEFSTWATIFVKQKIVAGIAAGEHDLRLPIYMQERVNHLNRMGPRLQQILATTSPSVEEIAAATGQSESRVRTTLRADSIARVVSLDALIKKQDDKGDTPFGETIPAPVNVEKEVINHLTSQEIRRTLGEVPLHPRLRGIISCRFGLDDREEETYGEIAERHDITGERIRQLIEEGLNKIRVVIKDPEFRNTPLAFEQLAAQVSLWRDKMTGRDLWRLVFCLPPPMGTITYNRLFYGQNLDRNSQFLFDRARIMLLALLPMQDYYHSLNGDYNFLFSLPDLNPHDLSKKYQAFCRTKRLYPGAETVFETFFGFGFRPSPCPFNLGSLAKCAGYPVEDLINLLAQGLHRVERAAQKSKDAKKPNEPNKSK